MKWWAPSQDEILARQIAEKQWGWRPNYEEIAITQPNCLLLFFFLLFARRTPKPKH
jgi:hypothetical protein